MSLHDPFYNKFDGSPDLGRIPTRLVVLGTGSLSGDQFRDVEHVYDQFRGACRLSASNFHTEQIKLSDGTVVHMWSLQGRDVVTVTPGGGDEEERLPHGFAVATNWQGPLIYCRDLNDGIQWLIGPIAPQIAGHTTTNYDNQAFRSSTESGEYFNLPHVRDHTNTVLWDYAQNGAPSVTPAPVVPFLLKNTTTGVFSIESPHYASGGSLIDAAGSTLYTMADEAPILTPAETTYQHPGVTDASGNQIALQAMRCAVISPSFNIWRFKLWSERLNRTGDSGYTLVERAATEFTTPMATQTTTVTTVNDSSLGEDPAMLFKFKATSSYLPGGYTSFSGYFGTARIGWSGPDAWIDITGIGISGSVNTALRQIVTQGAGVTTYNKLLCAPKETEVGYIPIEMRLNYPAAINWRGGSSQKWYYPENLAFLLTGSVSGFVPNNYRVYDVEIFRYDTGYDVDGAPSITADLGWLGLKLLEGSTAGRMSGKEYTNKLLQNGTYTWVDVGFVSTIITQEIKHNTDFPYSPTGDPYPGFTAWLSANNVKSLYWDDYLEYGTMASYLGPAPNNEVKYEYLFNNRPTNTASYNLTSRYVIDYDHKGRFYAAIRCEAICTGAEWEENLAVYKGYMQVKTNPEYTVKIWFECWWNGVFAQQLLAEEAVTRPMFEAVTVSQFNPWYWHLPAYADRDCKVRKPPEPTPDENFMMMFKNLASHQGVNTNLCCADVRPDITGADVALTQSQDGIEYSYSQDGTVIPHTRYVTGQLYARTFTLAELGESLWMLKQLKVDAIEDDFQPIDGPEKPTWFYHPAIKAALDVQRHIEVRDGVIVQWSDNIPGETSGYPPTPAAPPAATSRSIKLYRV